MPGLWWPTTRLQSVNTILNRHTRPGWKEDFTDENIPELYEDAYLYYVEGD